MSKIKQKIHYISKYLEEEGQIVSTKSTKKIYLNLAI